MVWFRSNIPKQRVIPVFFAVGKGRVSRGAPSREKKRNDVGLGLFILGTLLMSGLGLDVTIAIGSVAATLGNIGPGLGGVGPVHNYAAIPLVGKWILSGFMLLGRLEIYTVLLLLFPATWRR